jgi:hypothetical protein
MKKFMLDGVPINSDVPADYPGPLEFFTAPPEQMPQLLVEATRLDSHEAMQQAARNSTVIAVSEDQHWIAMVNRTPQDQIWVEVVERQA